MELVYPDMLRQALSQVAHAKDWPQYLIFVGLIPQGLITIGSRRLMHGDLLTGLDAHVEGTTGIRLEFGNEDVFDGYVEIESDGEMVVRSMGGRPVPPQIEEQILQLIEENRPV